MTQPDGKLVAVGQAWNGTSFDVALARFEEDGSLDTSFGTSGLVLTDISGESNDKATAIERLSNGQFVVAGWGDAGGTNDVYLLRYNVDGLLDTSFGGGDGIVTTTIGSGDDLGLALSVQSDDKIVISGYSDTGGNDFIAVRYDSTGNLDSSFGTSGIATFDLGSSSDDQANAVAIQTNGKIVLVGSSDVSGSTSAAILQLDTNGAIDSRFSLSDSLDGNPTYVEDGAAVTLDADVSIFDGELSTTDDFGGATLVLERNGGANSEDVFSATGNLFFNAGTLELLSSNIGTVTNTGGTLTLTFAAGVTNAQVNEVMQAIQYANSSDAPPASVQIDWTFNDQNSGAQGSGGALDVTGSTTVNITAVNDAPVIERPNLLVNGDLETGDLTGWTTTGTVTNTGGNHLRFGEGNVAGPHSASQSFTTVVGQTYTLTFQWRDDSASANQSLQIEVDGATNLLTNNRNSSTAGSSYVTYTYSFVADSTTSTLTFTDTSASSVGVDGYIDNVAVFEQPTFTSISEDDVNNAGNTVASILNSVSGDRVTDGDAEPLKVSPLRVRPVRLIIRLTAGRLGSVSRT